MMKLSFDNLYLSKCKINKANTKLLLQNPVFNTFSDSEGTDIFISVLNTN